MPDGDVFEPLLSDKIEDVGIAVAEWTMKLVTEQMRMNGNDQC
jgi:hypothetical protein